MHCYLIDCFFVVTVLWRAAWGNVQCYTIFATGGYKEDGGMMSMVIYLNMVTCLGI